MAMKSDILKRVLSLALALAMVLSIFPVGVAAHGEEAHTHAQEHTYSPLYQQIAVQPGQLVGDTGEIVENEIYGHVVGYELKKGHVLSIGNTDYVFSVRQLKDGNYSTLLKQATTASFTATEDMTVGMLIRKPDKSALTAEELASIVIFDSQYGMIGVEGYAQRFTVEAQTIDGGTAATRANIFLPKTYTEDGTPTKLIVMTNGYSAYLTDSVWNGNTADNVGIIQSYLDAGYAVYVVDNTAARTSQTPDLGCPQLVSSYLEAYEYIQEHFNVEEKFSIHSRSFGTFAAMRIMQEVPELVKCAVMTGPRVSIKLAYSYVDKTFVANRFGFADATGATYEADKLVGYDPYTDVNGESYALPPTYWVMCQGDETEEPMEVIEKLIAHGNDVTTITHTGTDHTGVCTLNTEEMFSDALAFLEDHQTEKVPEPETLEGKTISILGDSISTFSGVSNNTAYNSTIGGSAVYYSAGTLGVYQSDTWWQQAVDALGMELLVNNSWSGSCVLNTRSGTVGAYVDRCVNLHNDATGEEPEVIAVFLGTNDFSYYQSALGSADIDYDALITKNADGTFTYATPTTTCEAYAIMLHKMTNRYPDAEIYCMTLTARRDPDKEDNYADVGQPTAFNAELAEIIEKFGCTVVDLENCGIDKEAAVFDTYVGDGRVHPNAKGMDKITEALVEAMLGRETTLYSVSYDLQNVTADTNAKTVIEGGEFSAVLEMNEGCDKLTVSVTMGGEDVTEVACSDGKVTLSNITGDIVITASAVKPAENYRWEFDGSDLVSVSDTENALAKLGGSTENGLLVNVYYSMDRSVTLCHDREWSVEFKASGSWSGMLFSSLKSAGTEGNTFMFKTTSDSGLIAFGERRNSQYHNYGVPLTSLGVDTTEEHTYKLENRIAEDGSNMVYLLVDGVDYGAMNSYFIGGTNNQNKTVDWLSGKDFTFRYIGAASHPINNCELEYLAVWEGGNTTEQMPMRYDDHYDLTGKTVEIIDAGTPTSYKVGYGVAAGTLDDAVVTLDGDTLVATGIGTAKVRIDGQLYEVTVTAAPISLLLLAGQSNMQGSEGNADQSIVCEDGQVYSTYGDRYTMTVDNATNFAPSALTGSGSALNVNGTATNLEDWPVYLLNEAGAGKAGPDSGFAYEWVKQTGEKVWIVNAAHGGSAISTWQEGGANYEEAVALFSACQKTLRQEIAAGHYTLSHMGYFWCQGCTDETQTAQWYVTKYLAMHESLKEVLAMDIDGDGTEDILEFAGLIPIRSGHQGAGSYRAGTYTDTTTAPYFESFKDLRMNGPRVAQYWMGNNPELSDIWNVCTIQEDWATMPDGTDGVAEYFQAHYENGTVDYTTQVKQSTSWYTPTTPAAVHDSIHYNQIGYNEIGREAARNALIYLGEIEAPETEPTVEFVTWDGFTEAGNVTASTVGSSGTLVVPMVYPVYKSKEVTYQVSDGLRYEYYDLLADSYMTGGTLTAVGADGDTVTVAARELTSYRWDLEDGTLVSTGVNENAAARLQGSTTDGVFVDTRYRLAQPFVLLHDEDWVLEWKMTGPWYDDTSTASKKLFSEDGQQATVGAMTVLVSGKNNRISIGCYGGSTHISYGVNLAEYGISVSDTHTYRLVNRMNADGTNTIYLFADGEEIAPMTRYFTGSGGDMGTESDYLSGKDLSFGYMGTPSYLLDNGTIEYIVVQETGASGDIHFHNYSDWETVSVPTADRPGEERRTCAGCGETQEREVEGIWQTTNIADHLSQLPENVCAGTNLWAALEHDPTYYVYSQGDWGTHSSGNVYSVTIPVSEGDKIYASSFGAAGTNGGSKAGIRVAFFDAYGVVKTLAPADTYAEFTANGGYLIAPEGTVAVNVPMWTNSDEWELYILNRAHDYESAVTAPTCTEQGCTTHTCTLCGDSYTDSETAPLGHSFKRYISDGNATCTADGTKTAKCERCDVNDTVTDTGSAKGHSYEATVTKPTCTARGYTTHICASCKDSYIDSYVNATGHTYGNWEVTKQVSCTDTGMERRTCENCGYSENREVAATGHNYKSVVTAATCTDQGYTTYTCENCSDSYKDSYTEKLGHDYGEWFEAKAPTLETEGEERRDCRRCEEYQTRKLPVLTHNYESVVTAPTCTERGYTRHTCADCGDSYVDTYVDALGHSYGDWTLTKEATCTEKGAERRDCANCDHYETRGVAAIGHDYKAVVTAPTCVDEGCTTYTCDLCKDSYAADKVAALGHTEETIPAVVPTCTASGLTGGKYCSVCRETLAAREVVPATGHDFDTSVWGYKQADGHAHVCKNCSANAGVAAHTPNVAAPSETAAQTCTACGYVIAPMTGHICKNNLKFHPASDADCDSSGSIAYYECACGKYYEDAAAAREITSVTIPALGHDPSNVAGYAPTCTAEGLTEGSNCVRCGEVLEAQNTIPALGHAEETIPAVAPTCTASGLTEGEKCGTCGEILTARKTVPALGHNVVTDAAVAATCKTSGLTEGSHCDTCNEILVAQTVVEKLAHAEEAIPAVAATCTAAGLTGGVKCSACGDTILAQKVIPATGHTGVTDAAIAATCTETGLTNGSHCSVCGATIVAQKVIPAAGHSLVTDAGREATCTEDGLTEGKHCAACGIVSMEQTIIPATGHQWSSGICTNCGSECEHSYDTESGACTNCGDNCAHEYETVVTAPTCTAQGYTTYTCLICGSRFNADYQDVRGHSWADDTAAIKSCVICGYTEGGYRIDVEISALGEETSVWIDGVEHPVRMDESGCYVMLEHPNATNLVIYTYNDPGAEDVHTQYPIAMRVWILDYADGAYTATHIPEFDNLLQYSGSSIRIVGNKGIRMITSIDKGTRQALTGDGLAGYTLVEYGTAVAWASDLEGNDPLVLGQDYTKSNFAYKKGEADPIFKDTGSLIQYTNVLVGFTDDQCIPDLVMRPYIILEDADGERITLYGGQVVRSIGYIAWQNRNAFKVGSAAYDYVWSIIHHVYGDQFDADYSG